ncbi:uncharacterized protein LOC113351628 [Papaver somniferum]|uniref:uncharacterized protein LOC113351628 n=1 Tax=Papaver somniferum TaxID=3469 RepID=UPI000E702D12|nr:uncharacterized protein LOC113351628 [Papaver somniferum]
MEDDAAVFIQSSKADQSDPSAQNHTKKLPDCNLTKVVFKYVCANDESQNDNRPSTPLIRKQLKETAKSTYGVRASGICFVETSLFKEHIRSLMDSALDALNIKDLKITHIAKIEDFSPYDNLGTGCGLRVFLDQVFQIRTWETLTIDDDDKHLLVMILSELKRNGFDFTNDSMTLQNISEAVERAKTRKINTVKLNLPVPLLVNLIRVRLSVGENVLNLIYLYYQVAMNLIEKPRFSSCSYNFGHHWSWCSLHPFLLQETKSLIRLQELQDIQTHLSLK